MLRWGTKSSLFHRVPGDREPRRTRNSAGGSQEKSLGNNTVNRQVSMKGVGLLFREVNRRPDDEHQRERGTFGSAD